MGPAASIHRFKQPSRPHFIKEWASKKGFETPTALAKVIGADKSTVSRWFKGESSPAEDMQERLAVLFDCDRESLFRHPDEAWLVNFFAGRDQEEIDRMKAMLEAAFPLKKTVRG
ncbi:XRE family transcriptional regulator [Methylovirgula ligni]|uniref:helix-turn-helix domain-containing protein n=1 Tax=Methylovirgula ligni TaxID=569860 RepID=UPI000E247EBC|nr:helix-turn-helix transcriptional regulator [Methylovirgula ligni]QAY96679.1 XRE family transcriptional regulator [Methylovirgula ligni]